MESFFFPFNCGRFFFEYSSIGCQSWSYRTWNILLQALLSFKVSIEVPAVILIDFIWHLFFSLEVFSTLSLFCILSILTMICHREFLFLYCLFRVLCASCILWVCFVLVWWHLQKRCYSLFKILSMLLTLDISPSFMPMIWEFGLSLVSHISCLYFLIF